MIPYDTANQVLAAFVHDCAIITKTGDKYFISPVERE